MRSNRIAQRLVFAADLPDAPLPGMPLVEIFGKERVLIENHQGVTQYGRETICIKVKFGQICIAGCDLELARMTKEQLVITGRIDGISLSGGCS